MRLIRCILKNKRKREGKVMDTELIARSRLHRSFRVAPRIQNSNTCSFGTSSRIQKFTTPMVSLSFFPVLSSTRALPPEKLAVRNISFSYQLKYK
jgi:hypothetical protein